MRCGISWLRRSHLAGLLLLLAACGGSPQGNEAPLRVETAAAVPRFQSRVSLPVTLPIATLQALIEAEVPRRIAAIDSPRQTCVPPARLRIGDRRLKVTPTIRCDIVGHVDRGPIRLSGRGETLLLRMPVEATVSARDIGGIIRSETATAAAEIRATVRLSLDRRWQPVARIAIDYDWTEEPGIDFLGRRIRFARRADPQLERLIADLERQLPARLRTLGVDRQVADLWQKGFTAIDVNRANPEVWLRLTPTGLGVGAIRAEGSSLLIPIALDAELETFVGPRPPDPKPTPLPPMTPVDGRERALRFAAPVIADFGELEPIVGHELAKLAAQPIDVPLAGPTRVAFGRPTLYATSGGRLAIGLPMQVKPARQMFATSGTVWLTGLPTNEPNSRRIVVRDFAIAGDVDSVSGNILLRVAQSPAVLATLERSLAHDFEGDFQKLMAKIETVLQALPIGDFVATATIAGVENGVVQPVGQGLFLPVEAHGQASLRYAPAQADSIRAAKRREREARAAARARASG